MKYSEMIEKALDMIKTNDDLFVDLVNELDSWDGFADGFRGYPMYELNDLFCDTKVGDFLDMLASDFSHNDEYFIDTVYGLSSCDDLAAHYRDNVDDGELLDNIIDKYNHLDLDWINADFSELIENIVNYDDDQDDETLPEIAVGDKMDDLAITA